MILKGTERSGGQDLAAHLMRLDENDHVEVHEVRGFSSDNLKDAFKEAEAISRGTRCRNYLFSLSLSPPEEEQVPVEIFEETIGRIEQRLGLEGSRAQSSSMRRKAAAMRIACEAASMPKP